MSMKPLFHSLLLVPLLVACSFQFDDPLEGNIPEDSPVVTPDMSEEEWTEALLVLVNHTRQQGCRCGTTYMQATTPLEIDEQLNLAAQVHAEDMYENKFFKHKGSDGSRVGDRATRMGYDWQAIGENISAGYPNVMAAFEGWKSSPPHCENMMSPDYKHMGAGKKGSYWVQTFGNRFN